jgi:hypothetical protein
MRHSNGQRPRLCVLNFDYGISVDSNAASLQAAGVAEPSMLSALLQDHELTAGLSLEERDSRLKELALGLYAGE